MEEGITMKFLKFLLILIAAGLGVYVLFWLFGVLYGLFWWFVWIGIIAVGGYTGYKLFLEKEKEPAQLEEKKPTAIAEMERLDRQLEEYKQKYTND